MEKFINFLQNNLSNNVLPNHIKIVAKEIERGFFNNQNITRLLMISMPPGSGKTLLASKLFPLWINRNFKNMSIGLFSYNLNIVVDNIKLMKDSILYNKMSNVNIFASSIGSSCLGNIFNIYIIDDYINNEGDAQNENIKSKMFEWFINLITYNNHLNSFFLIISTRWAKNDLIGNIVEYTKEEGIKCLTNYINIPVLEYTDQKFKSYWPEKYSEEILLNIKERIGEKLFRRIYLGCFNLNKE